MLEYYVNKALQQSVQPTMQQHKDDCRVVSVGKKQLTLFFPISSDMDWKYTVDRICSEMNSDGRLASKYASYFHSEKGFMISLLSSWNGEALVRLFVIKVDDDNEIDGVDNNKSTMLKMTVDLSSYQFHISLLILQRFCDSYDAFSYSDCSSIRQDPFIYGLFDDLIHKENKNGKAFSKLWRNPAESDDDDPTKPKKEDDDDSDDD